MKSGLFITVRSDSSRLPNKALVPILGKPTIELVILRAKQVTSAGTIVVCTTDRAIDDAIVEIAKRNGVEFYRGSLEDKLERWLGAARLFDVDFFITMDGDDLFCDPELMELGIEQMRSAKNDFIEAPEGLICGSFTYGIKTSALAKVCDIKGTSDTEMMWVYFKDTGIFNIDTLKVADKIFYDSSIRMTLDYEEDLAFFTKILERYKAVNNDVPLRQIVAFLVENRDIIAINSYRHQEWANNQKQKTKLILKFESGSPL
jgi:spore coat polysaccharide biosynthesis protein SpsF (cytidylyltransferase family)